VREREKRWDLTKTLKSPHKFAHLGGPFVVWRAIRVVSE
jgi:hypothetical protein